MTRATSGRTGHLDHLENEVSEVTTLLKDNVEKVLERGERIDNLQSRSEDLEVSSSQFKRSGIRLRKKMCWQNCKMNCLIALVIFLVIATITTIVLVETKPWEDSSSGTPGKTTAVPVTTQKSTKMTTLLMKALKDPDVFT